jgi:hypothetical protein
MLKAFKYLNIFHLFNIFIIIVAVTSIHGNLAYGVAGMTHLVCTLISDTAEYLVSVEVHLFVLLPVFGWGVGWKEVTLKLSSKLFDYGATHCLTLSLDFSIPHVLR